jgi:hypothetical protein
MKEQTMTTVSCSVCGASIDLDQFAAFELYVPGVKSTQRFLHWSCLASEPEKVARLIDRNTSRKE